MEFQDVVRRRRMVRAFEDRPLPEDVMERILDNATRAPSAGFSQGFAFLVIERGDDQQRFWEAIAPGDEPHGGQMPLLIVCLSHKQAYLDRYAEPDKGWTDRDPNRWPVPYWDIDTGFASLLMLLGVVDEGLGACFFGIPPDLTPGYRAAFGVPDAFNPIGAITIGYRAKDRRSPSLARGRREASTVTHRGRWGG
jgi:nitroreductase